MAITTADLIVGGGGLAVAVYGFTQKSKKNLGLVGVGVLTGIIALKVLSGLGQPITVRTAVSSYGQAASYTSPNGYFHSYPETMASPNRYTVKA